MDIPVVVKSEIESPERKDKVENIKEVLYRLILRYDMTPPNVFSNLNENAPALQTSRTVHFIVLSGGGDLKEKWSSQLVQNSLALRALTDRLTDRQKDGNTRLILLPPLLMW